MSTIALPKDLLRQGRVAKEDSSFKNHDRLYARHKPGVGWDEKEGLPDFTQIKMTQSLNWCLYSLPHWCRFNDAGEYLNNYAVVSYSHAEITNISEQSEEKRLSGNIKALKIIHDPIELNYSHCELRVMSDLGSINKTDRRAIRAKFKHASSVELKPFERPNRFINAMEFIKMKTGRLLRK